MMYLGASGCIVSQATRDGGADVVSADFVAEVKHYASPVGPDLIRQIFGVAISEGKRPLFFTKTGYTEGARNFAEKNLVALFVYDHAAGTLTARSTEGERALRLGLQAIKGRK
jgi:HJR/Mrr/RecB family endonuclease